MAFSAFARLAIAGYSSLFHLQMEYKNNACRPGVHEKIVEMAMNGAGTRDTGRVLGISKDTVTSVLKNEKIRQAGSRRVSKEDRG